MHFTPEHEHFHEAQEPGGLDARAKIIAFLGVALGAVSAPRGQWMILAAYAALLLALVVALQVPPLRLLKRMAAAAPFVLLIVVFLPFRPIDYAHGDRALEPLGLSEQGVFVFLDIIAKATLSIGSIAALGAIESVAGISRGFQRMRVPAIFVTLLNFTYRYLFVLRDEAQRMRRARDARAFGGRWLWNARVIGHMVGSLFLRSVERAERVYFAMASRGYDGGALRIAPKRLNGGEWLFMAASVLVIVTVRLMPL